MNTNTFYEFNQFVRVFDSQNDPHSLHEPVLFQIEQGEERLTEFLKTHPHIQLIDTWEDQMRECAIVKNPGILQNPSVKGTSERTLQEDFFVYYPWRQTILRILGKEDFLRVKHSRNAHLISGKEQKKFEECRIGIAGLNVGNPAAICLALEGGGAEMKFADNDILSLSNLNRFRAGLLDLGLNKAILSARQAYEINPFIKISVFPDGIQQGKEEEFLLAPEIDVLIEEMDNLPLKISIREKAREYKIPVIMVTGNEEGLILDVERFDLDADLPLLNGYLSPDVIEKVQGGKLKEMPFQEKILLARDFMGANELTKRLQESFLLVGKKLAGIPQLAEASFLRGAVLTYIARKIATGENMPSGRYRLQLATLFHNT